MTRSVDYFLLSSFFGENILTPRRPASILRLRFKCQAKLTLSQKVPHTLPWNSHYIAALRILFDAHIVELSDWNLRVTGEDDVIKANEDIFDTFPNVFIDIVDALVCVSKRAVTCEIIVHLNDAANTTFTAVDVLRFNEKTEICSVRAYKL